MRAIYKALSIFAAVCVLTGSLCVTTNLTAAAEYTEGTVFSLRDYVGMVQEAAGKTPPDWNKPYTPVDNPWNVQLYGGSWRDVQQIADAIGSLMLYADGQAYPGVEWWENDFYVAPAHRTGADPVNVALAFTAPVEGYYSFSGGEHTVFSINNGIGEMGKRAIGVRITADGAKIWPKEKVWESVAGDGKVPIPELSDIPLTKDAVLRLEVTSLYADDKPEELRLKAGAAVRLDKIGEVTPAAGTVYSTKDLLDETAEKAGEPGWNKPYTPGKARWAPQIRSAAGQWTAPTQLANPAGNYIFYADNQQSPGIEWYAGAFFMNPVHKSAAEQRQVALAFTAPAEGTYGFSGGGQTAFAINGGIGEAGKRAVGVRITVNDTRVWPEDKEWESVAGSGTVAIPELHDIPMEKGDVLRLEASSLYEDADPFGLRLTADAAVTLESVGKIEKPIPVGTTFPTNDLLDATAAIAGDTPGWNKPYSRVEARWGMEIMDAAGQWTDPTVLADPASNFFYYIGASVYPGVEWWANDFYMTPVHAAGSDRRDVALTFTAPAAGYYGFSDDGQTAFVINGNAGEAGKRAIGVRITVDGKKIWPEDTAWESVAGNVTVPIPELHGIPMVKGAVLRLEATSLYEDADAWGLRLKAGALTTYEGQADPGDHTSPVFGGILALEDRSTTSLTLRWQAASDETSPDERIRYEVFVADAPIDRIPGEGGASAGGNITYTLTGLTPDTPYYVAVVARDFAGNAALLSGGPFSTEAPDTTAPVISGSVRAVPDIRSLSLTWDEAADDRTAQEDLTYTVYCGYQPYDSLPAASGLAAPRRHAATVTGLSPSTVYYAAVVVADKAGNRAMITGGPFTTDAEDVLLATYPLQDFADRMELEIGGHTNTGWSTDWCMTDLTRAVDSPWSAQIAVDGGAYHAAPLGSNDHGGNLWLHELPGLAGYGLRFKSLMRSSKDAFYLSPGKTDAHAYDVAWAFTAPRTGTYRLDGGQSAAFTGQFDDARRYGLRVTLNGTKIWPQDEDWTVLADSKKSADIPVIRKLSLNPGDILRIEARVTTNVVSSNAGIAMDARVSLTAAPADAQPPVFDGEAVTQTAVTSTTLSLSWPSAADAVTPARRLTYLVYTGTEPFGSIPVSGGREATAGTSITLTGLAPGTVYYAAVVAQDEAGNRSMIQGGGFRTPVEPDTAAPTFTPGSIEKTGAELSSLTVRWPAATDNKTAAADIVYTVYCAKTAFATGTLPTGDGMAVGAATAATLTGLEAGTAYYVAVTAADEAGNKAVIVSGALRTATEPPADTAPPVFETGVVSAADISAHAATLRWPAAADEVSPAGKIRYALYYSTAPLGDGPLTGTKVETGTDTVAALTGLTADTTYYLVVTATDEAGNTARLAGEPFRTKAEATSPASSEPAVPTSTPTNGASEPTGGSEESTPGAATGDKANAGVAAVLLSLSLISLLILRKKTEKKGGERI